MINSLKYISTRGSAPELSFKDVIFEGLASDGGLYVPKHWPCLSNELIDSFSSMTYQEIAYEVISPYIDSTLSDEDLKAIIKKSYSCFDNFQSSSHNFLMIRSKLVYSSSDANRFLGSI